MTGHHWLSSVQFCRTSYVPAQPLCQMIPKSISERAPASRRNTLGCLQAFVLVTRSSSSQHNNDPTCTAPKTEAEYNLRPQPLVSVPPPTKRRSNHHPLISLRFSHDLKPGPSRHPPLDTRGGHHHTTCRGGGHLRLKPYFFRS